MTKYHIGKNGKIRKCMAKGKCPLGGDAPHFESEEEAQEYLDGLNAEEFGLLHELNEDKEDAIPLKGDDPQYENWIEEMVGKGDYDGEINLGGGNYHIENYEDEAYYLYEEGWRSDNKDEIIEEYGFTEEDADILLEHIEELEAEEY